MRVPRPCGDVGAALFPVADGRFSSVRACIAFASLSFALLAAPRLASATEVSYPTTVVGSPSAPVALTMCRLHHNDYVHEYGLNLTNRSDVFLTSYVVRWTFYDHEGAAMGQDDLVQNPNEALAPGDSLSLDLQNYITDKISEPIIAIGRATCRLQSAHFEGNKTWTYGRQWNGRLRPVAAAHPFAETSAVRPYRNTDVSNMSEHGSSQVSVSVAKAWNDAYNGQTMVHAAVSLAGGASDAQIRPEDFVLTMLLANGAKKTYGALTQAAPTYQKLNGLSGTMTSASEVDPTVDLGALGTIVVPAHGNVGVVVSFFVPDAVADPSDNKDVALR